MKEITIIFFCSWKFAATFPVAIYVMKMSFAETLIYTNIGGIMGTLFSLFLSDTLIKMWNNYKSRKASPDKKKRKIFTKQNRRIVRLKSKYGLLGIVALSPVILSIPLGSFLIVRYYGNKRRNILWQIMGQILWSVIYTIFYMQVRTILT